MTLNRETIKLLTPADLGKAQGGWSPTMAYKNACSTLDGGCVSGDSTFVGCAGPSKITCVC
jgi:hypothetical protein